MTAWARGEVIALRYVTTDGRIEICWPCRIVEDGPDLLALHIARGTVYRAWPKKPAREKRESPDPPLPLSEKAWRTDTLRLMIPGRSHSVWLSWDGDGRSLRFLKYFVNLEEPFRRTSVGVDTQDHTLDIELTPGLQWRWRDEEELLAHVEHGFYTPELAAAARAEGERVVAELLAGTHPCTRGWADWRPDPQWQVPTLPAAWDTTAPTSWERRYPTETPRLPVARP
ncbi:MAG TPA: DUF402 domain-containing protein [Gammaproteobacteria bacterium]